jgi:uncharacterized protein YjbI with pentapeptide repeats
MSQDQQPRPWWKDNWSVLALVALMAVIATITILGYLQRWTWTEFLWRWLELFIIPLVLALGALWFNRQERKAQNDIETRRQESEQAVAREERENDRKIAEDRAREEALQRYLDTMQGLILDKGLRRSKKDAEIRDVARARTLAVLRSLDSNRRSQVVRFLHEADLIGEVVEELHKERQVIGNEAIIDLVGADLSGADLSNANLIGVCLKGTNLRSTNLSGTILRGADLRGADLRGVYLMSATLYNATLHHTSLRFAELINTNLSDAKLVGVDLSSANLSYANLTDAYLIDANLSYARLVFANLRGANLRGANLSDADLFSANLGGADLESAILLDANLNGVNLSGTKGWTNQRLARAKSLVRATLPNGRTVIKTEEAWEEFKKLYGPGTFKQGDNSS